VSRPHSPNFEFLTPSELGIEGKEASFGALQHLLREECVGALPL